MDVQTTTDAVSELRAATNALLLVRRRDQGAWPIAEVLAEMWQRAALAVLLDEMTGRAVPEYTPVLKTERDLADVFGAPAVRTVLTAAGAGPRDPFAGRFHSEATL